MLNFLKSIVPYEWKELREEECSCNCLNKVGIPAPPPPPLLKKSIKNKKKLL